jgi:hypothetical protein
MNTSIERGDYILSTDRDKLDFATIHQWLSTDTYWAMRRPLEVVKASIANSLPFGIFLRGPPEQPEEQVAFARAITDYCLFPSFENPNDQVPLHTYPMYTSPEPIGIKASVDSSWKK